MKSDRLDNGVRKRRDGRGDAWANAHRLADPKAYMSDVDGCIGVLTWASNLDQRLFAEYEPDAWEHREKLIRRFGIVALFDRKCDEQDVFGPDAEVKEEAKVSLAFYLYLCRTVSSAQPTPCRFFYVFGDYGGSSWVLQEMDIQTGEKISMRRHEAENMQDLWRALGLRELREFLRDWMSE